MAAADPKSAGDRRGTATGGADVLRLGAELFLTTVAPALVKEVASLLLPRGIPVMPLKGVLLQKIVYKNETVRHLADVDLLVPAVQFMEAHSILLNAGFTRTHWEGGAWQVTMRKPAGPPLSIDLHRRLCRTQRSRLTTAGMFQRGSEDVRLFGAPVIVPCANDLFAHLIQHAALHWIAKAQLHRPEDFQAVADALSLDAGRCADHLRVQGLTRHALVILPMVARQTGAPFAEEVAARLRPVGLRDRVAVLAVRAAGRRAHVGTAARRLAGVALAPSLWGAFVSAARDRLSTLRRTATTSDGA